MGLNGEMLREMYVELQVKAVYLSRDLSLLNKWTAWQWTVEGTIGHTKKEKKEVFRIFCYKGIQIKMGQHTIQIPA